MMMFKIDTHVHTAESSLCGRMPAAEVVSLYADAGYDAIVICDHFLPAAFRKQSDLTWVEQVDHCLAGYRTAREAGERAGLRVFLGAELRLTESPNDYLLFGLDEEDLYANRGLLERSLRDVRDLAEQVGGIVVQAHPFRPNMVRVDPGCVHGVEVINGHPNHASDNARALEWARENGLTMTAGSDAHFREGAARAWMTFSRPLARGAGLATAIRKNEAIEIGGPDGLSMRQEVA